MNGNENTTCQAEGNLWHQVPVLERKPSHKLVASPSTLKNRKIKASSFQSKQYKENDKGQTEQKLNEWKIEK